MGLGSWDLNLGRKELGFNHRVSVVLAPIYQHLIFDIL
jgi:hypothetical protein